MRWMLVTRPIRAPQSRSALLRPCHGAVAYAARQITSHWCHSKCRGMRSHEHTARPRSGNSTRRGTPQTTAARRDQLSALRLNTRRRVRQKKHTWKRLELTGGVGGKTWSRFTERRSWRTAVLVGRLNEFCRSITFGRSSEIINNIGSKGKPCCHDVT